MEEQLQGVLREMSCGSHNNNEKQKQNETQRHMESLG